MKTKEELIAEINEMYAQLPYEDKLKVRAFVKLSGQRQKHEPVLTRPGLNP